MPVKDETIDAALNAKTPEERKAAIKAMMREWLTTMPPEEKKAMIADMTAGTVGLMRKLQALQKPKRR